MTEGSALTFSTVERIVLDAITDMYPELTQAMQTQLANCRVTARPNFSAGYFVSFEVAEGVPPLDTPHGRFGEVFAEVEEIPDLLRFELRAGNYAGRRFLDILECTVEGNAALDELDLTALTFVR